MLLIWSVAAGAGLQILSDVRANVRGTCNNAVAFKTWSGALPRAHARARAVRVLALRVAVVLPAAAQGARVDDLPDRALLVALLLNSQINHLTAETAHRATRASSATRS